MDLFSIVVLGLISIIAWYLISIYNKLVLYQTRVKNAFAQIEVQLRRRYDLIPNLVETAKAYLKHEAETLEAVIQARNQAISGLQQTQGDPTNSSAMQSLGTAETGLMGALGKLNVVMEDYPDLKADATMMQLSSELTHTENKVAFARQAFNDAVLLFNSYMHSFPQQLIADKYGMNKEAAFLEMADHEAIQEAPKVSF
ncbi:MAG: LemA family protein [Candidatus Marinimicrobia bacterium]|nr:LemA family protein [Candidatus Neomarinimicrobiota bacterium]